MKIRWALAAAVIAAAAMFLAAEAFLADRGDAGLTSAGWKWETQTELAERIVAAWPEKPRLVARAMIERYGPPETVGSGRMDWVGRWPWKRIVVRSSPETPPLEQVVEYHVPASKRLDVERFSKDVVVNPGAVELSSRADDEETNRLNLNLAADIVMGVKTPEQAERFFRRTLELRFMGKSSPYLERLRFYILPEESPYDSDRWRI